MLCFTSGAARAREGVALSRQSASGAPVAEGRAARVERDSRLSLAETAQLPPGDLRRRETSSTWLRLTVVFMLVGLTFDMRGAQKAQPFGHPLDGGVRPHAQQRKPTFQTRNFGDGLHGQSVAVTNPTVAKSRCRA